MLICDGIYLVGQRNVFPEGFLVIREKFEVGVCWLHALSSRIIVLDPVEDP